MSLINRMLQDLDARRSDRGGAVPYDEQVRAVPERRGIHPAWWVALALAVALTGMVAWLLLRPPAPAQPVDRPQLPLKLDMGIERENSPAIPPVPGPTVAIPTATVPTAAGDQPVEPAPPITTNAQAVMPDTAEPTLKAASEDSAPATGKRSAAKATPATQVDSSDVPRESAAASDVKRPRAATKAQIATPAKTAETVTAPAELSKQMREPTPQQRAENEYRKALLSMQQGKSTEAINGLELALQLDPQHAAARQTLIGALVDAGRVDDAIRRTREALQQDPAQAGLAMMLARLQMEKGELRSAIETLERALPYGAERADYQAFLAALVQRDQRHKDATQHYLLALKASPQNGVWWMGLGISLQADNRLPEAQEAFKRAKATNSLSADLQAFVDTKLSQLKQ
jgi:MSHA biogenesis protein MshN